MAGDISPSLSVAADQKLSNQSDSPINVSIQSGGGSGLFGGGLFSSSSTGSGSNIPWGMIITAAFVLLFIFLIMRR